MRDLEAKGSKWRSYGGAARQAFCWHLKVYKAIEKRMAEGASEEQALGELQAKLEMRSSARGWRVR